MTPKKISATLSKIPESIIRTIRPLTILPWTYWLAVALPGSLSVFLLLRSGDPASTLAIIAFLLGVPVLHYATSMVLLYAIARHTDGEIKATGYILRQASLSVKTWTFIWLSAGTIYLALWLVPLGVFFLAITPAVAASKSGVQPAPLLIAYTGYTVAYLAALWILMNPTL